MEYKIKEAYFISAKTYCLILENGEVIIKAKGVLDNSLSVDDFLALYNNKSVTAIKQESKIDYGKGYVSIDDKSIKLNHDGYKKRQKVYNENNI